MPVNLELSYFLALFDCNIAEEEILKKVPLIHRFGFILGV
tara:strand:+ start:281 stop:400 length:120 start_codon:yes stop_codon:yes gene_type:complete